MSLNWEDTSPLMAERLERALGYPYAIPDQSYIVHNNAVTPMLIEKAEVLREHRIPVLAVGSNQSPDQIIRKFHGPDWAPIPCERCVIKDFDTVYSAHISGYGSIAAALHPSPGTTVSLYVNWLHESHMDRMHSTELGNENYVFARLDDVNIQTEHGMTLNSVHFYNGNAGVVTVDGAPVPLLEVFAENRQWNAMDQRAIQAHIHEMTAADLSLEEFILSSISDPDERNRRADIMRKNSVTFSHEPMVILQR